jgi:hypothetical protein
VSRRRSSDVLAISIGTVTVGDNDGGHDDGGDDDGGPAGPGPLPSAYVSWTAQVSTTRSVNDQCAVPRRPSICPQLLRRCVLFDSPWVLAVIATPLIRGVFECRKHAVYSGDEPRVIGPWDRCSPCFCGSRSTKGGSILERFRVLRDAESVLRDQCDH